MDKAELDPWRVIRGFLSKVRSYDVPDIVDRSGLVVDWNISDRENYSHITRWAAYRPRIDAAYDALSDDDDRLRVAFTIAREVFKRGLGEELDAALKEIGWSLYGDRLTPAKADVRELFFPKESQHDAYVEIRAKLQQAKQSITIVDPYIDGSVLTLLAELAATGIKIQLLTAHLPKDFELEIKKWAIQHKAIVGVRKTRIFHDRFISVDGEIGRASCRERV